MASLRIAGAQLNVVVGDLEGNGNRIGEAMTWAEEAGADVLLLPELAITGYPPEDLLLRKAFVDGNLEVLDDLAARSGETVVVVGFVDRAEEEPPRLDDAVERRTANAAALLAGGEVRAVYHKALLPNYGVFDEDRYFVPGPADGRLFDVGGAAVGVSICEDIWVPDGAPAAQAGAGAQVLVNINGSPYHLGKGAERVELLSGQARRFGLPLVYLNLVGGQDELVFDGQSMAFDGEGNMLFRAGQFTEEQFLLDLELPERRTGVETIPVRVAERSGPLPRADVAGVAASLDPDEEIYAALRLGLADYVRKNGFSGVVVGLSGGIDSALTTAIAVDALGPDAVRTVAMPGPYNSPESLQDAAEVARRLGCRFDVVGIDGVFEAYRHALAAVFEGTAEGVAEENLQARSRGAILMAVSNKFGGMVLATGNKSEMAVGYATLYGDMAGGFAVLKDVFKTRVYRLAAWRNKQGPVIPDTVMNKPPSAELRPDQVDTDSLPPYEVLDALLERYVEADESVETIIAGGADPATARRVAAMVDGNEYKRRQAAPGVKITRKAFGRDRRLPITVKRSGPEGPK